MARRHERLRSLFACCGGGLVAAPKSRPDPRKRSALSAATAGESIFDSFPLHGMHRPCCIVCALHIGVPMLAGVGALFRPFILEG